MVSMVQSNQCSEILRILVVDDDEATARSLAWLLRLYGYEVQTAPDGRTALQAAQARPPDVVLLDLGLPGMDGYEVAKRLREQADQARPFLIALSGYGQRSDRLRSRQAGIDLHLVKPVEPERLCRLLARFQAVLGPEAEPVLASGVAS
jgi:DNA-binding response OmpR family regulator